MSISDHEDPSEPEHFDVPAKTAAENKRRQDRKMRMQDRDIRKLAAAILAFHREGTLDEYILESLIEIVRRH